MDNTINIDTIMGMGAELDRTEREADALAQGVMDGAAKGWSREGELAIKAATQIGKRIGLSSVRSAIGAAVKERHAPLAAELRTMARQAAFARAGVADPSIRPRR
jgi:hypothetical protein